MNDFLLNIDTDLAITITTALIILLVAFIVIFIFSVVIPAQTLVAAIIGFIFGLVFSFLIAFVLTLFTGGLSIWVSIAITASFSIIGVAIAVARKKELLPFMNSPEELLSEEIVQHRGHFLLDTSVLIDGRIANLMKSGFFDHKVELLSTVTKEIYNLINSSDKYTQEKSKRGIDIINAIRQDSNDLLIAIEVEDLPEGTTLNDSLIAYAEKYQIGILTTDTMISSLAREKNITVLNLNELSRMIRSTAMHGEKITLQVIELGTAANEGVGFLEDGTKVVVKNGDVHVGRQIQVMVDNVLETVGGRVIYTTPVM